MTPDFMDALNGFCNGLFNILFAPFDGLGGFGALVTITIVSIVFMPLSMLFFKRFSSQRGIAAAKGKIKGHMIEIRIYQDDLVVVLKAVGKVLYYNFKYLFLNFAPFIPISVPFVLVVAQLVVRFGFAPIPVEERNVADLQAGQGVTITVHMQPGHEAEAKQLKLILPDTLQAVSPLVRSAEDGVAFQEVVAVAAGARDLELQVGTQMATKRIVTGTEIERLMQPERVNDFWLAWLWPAEPTFGGDSAFATVSFTYPDRELKWMPDGAEGVFLMFLIIAFVIGGAAIKIFDIQI
jgi:hypothetical protein